KAYVHAVVAAGQRDEVPHRLQLADLGQRRVLLPLVLRRDQLVQRQLVYVQLRQAIPAPARRSLFENERHAAFQVIAADGPGHANPSSAATSRSISSFVRASVTQNKIASNSSG